MGEEGAVVHYSPVSSGHQGGHPGGSAAALPRIGPQLRGEMIIDEPHPSARTQVLVHGHTEIQRVGELVREHMRELLEMRYLWQNPIRLDNTRLLAFLSEEPHTPLEVEVHPLGVGC
jgi:hypothetical protein